MEDRQRQLILFKKYLFVQIVQQSRQKVQRQNMRTQIQKKGQKVSRVQELSRPKEKVIKKNNYMIQEQLDFQKPSKTLDFHRIVQAGDFVLDQNFSESYSVFGFTKAGKTTTGHMLCNLPLKSVQTFDGLVYQVDPISNFSDAKIGGEPISQTKIPNIFYANEANQKGVNQNFCIFDQPGFNDSAGFHDLLGNGYFHYKTFSKVSKLKFLITIEKADLSGIAENFKKVIFLFINFFKDYQKIKHQILKATAILITKIQPHMSVDVVKQFITKIKNNMQGMSASEAKIFNQFVENMVNNNKIGLIPRPQKPGKKSEKNIILKDLHQKTSFWTRQIVNGKVDMKDINFSVTAEVIDKLTASSGNEQFESNFDQYLSKIKFKTSKFIGENKSSLEKLVELLKLDAMNNSSQYLQFMNKSYPEQYSNFDNKFNYKRQKLETSLLANRHLDQDLQNPQRKRRNNKSVNLDQINETQRQQMYFIKKFQILDYIQFKSKMFIDQKDQIFAQRTVNSLEEIKQFFNNIFHKIYYSQLDQQYLRAISKTYYLLQRLIEQNKIIILILLGDDNIRSKLLGLKQTEILSAFITTQAKGLINKWANIPIQKMKLQYIQNLNLDKLSIPINMDVINFLESCQGVKANLYLKLAHIVVKYYRKNSDAHIQKISLIGQKILNYRVYFQNFISNPDKKLQDDIESIIFITSKILAKILIQFDQIPIAIEIYKNINSPEGIFQICREKVKNAAYSQTLVNQLCLYAQYAASYSRIDLAIQCYQEAFHNQDNASKRKAIGHHIHNLSTQRNSNEINNQTYLKRLNQQILSEKLDQLDKTLVAKIRGAFKIWYNT